MKTNTDMGAEKRGTISNVSLPYVWITSSAAGCSCEITKKYFASQVMWIGQVLRNTSFLLITRPDQTVRQTQSGRQTRRQTGLFLCLRLLLGSGSLGDRVEDGWCSLGDFLDGSLGWVVFLWSNSNTNMEIDNTLRDRCHYFNMLQVSSIAGQNIPSI